MELLQGEELQALAPLPFKRACRIARDLCSVLSLLHSRRLLYRDLNPRNLKVLKDARLVIVRAEGTRRLYAVDRRGIGDLRMWLDGFWDDALGAFKRAAELEANRERRRR